MIITNIFQRKFVLNKRLLEDSESSDEDWEVITNGFERDDQKINGLIAEKNEAISNLTILINEATRIKAMIYETSKEGLINLNFLFTKTVISVNLPDA